MGITRRDLLKATAAGVALSGIGLPFAARAGDTKTIKIGFCAPLTGPVSAWGLPGLYGCEVWANRVNQAGGINIGGEPHMVEFVSWDTEYLADKALQGYRKLVAEDGVKFVMMLGGDPMGAVVPWMNRQRMLTSTLLPSDLNPNTPYLVAPAEVHPIYNVTGVEWMAEKYPDIKTVAMAAQNDSLGLPSVATYLAAFEGAGIKTIDQNIFDPATTDFAPIVSSLLANKPDAICLDTCYADYVNLITEQLYFQKYDGQIISCTYDNYPKILAKTSEDFMNGIIFQFPDFDDPALNSDQVNFTDPNGFFQEYNKLHPNTWTAVSWEYASIMDLWKLAAEKGGSAEPMDVLETWKGQSTLPHIWGNAKWWGKELWGIDNALVGSWPVVAIEGGRARIQAFKSIPAWWDKHGDLMLKHMKEMNLMS